MFHVSKLLVSYNENTFNKNLSTLRAKLYLPHKVEIH